MNEMLEIPHHGRIYMESRKTPYFLESEKRILKELVYRIGKDVIEAPSNARTMVEAKICAWRQITEEFNEASTIYPREQKQLKALWKNMKSRSKHRLEWEKMKRKIIENPYEYTDNYYDQKFDDLHNSEISSNLVMNELTTPDDADNLHGEDRLCHNNHPYKSHDESHPVIKVERMDSPQDSALLYESDNSKCNSEIIRSSYSIRPMSIFSADHPSLMNSQEDIMDNIDEEHLDDRKYDNSNDKDTIDSQNIYYIRLLEMAELEHKKKMSILSVEHKRKMSILTTKEEVLLYKKKYFEKKCKKLELEN